MREIGRAAGRLRPIELACARLPRLADDDASSFDMLKYDRDQPRVPAGSGRESGRWGGSPKTVANRR